MISLKHKFLFIHPPKTGGTSVEAVLLKYCEFVGENPNRPLTEHFQIWKGRTTKHWNPRHYSNNWDTRGFFKFACVRNPWSRYLSQFFMINKEAWTRDTFYEFVSQCTNNFVRAKFSFRDDKRKPHAIGNPSKPKLSWTRPQDGIVFDFNSQYKKLGIGDARPGEEMDHFIYFNKLQEGFDKACDEIGIPRETLPHKNKGKYREDNKHYTEYYDDELIEMIRENYKDDIDYFGFKYGE